jgi:hypothetical protein
MKIATAQSPQFTPDQPVQQLVEGNQFTLQCTFTLPSLAKKMIVGKKSTVLTAGSHEIAELDARAVRSFVDNSPNSDIIYTVEFKANRSFNQLRIICSQHLRIDGNVTMFNETTTLNVSYPPYSNVSDSTVVCANITTRGGHQVAQLSASRIFEDPGNPTSTVQWTWKSNGTSITDGTSGLFDGILNQRVTRADNNRLIVARYGNAFGFTMQQFSLCVNSVPGVPTLVTCSSLLNGYSCSWKPPSDTGGYEITHYNVGHKKGKDKPEDLLMVPSSLISYSISTLKAGVLYTFAVSAANVLGSGPSASDNVITPLYPENIVVIGQSRLSVQVTWKAPLNQDTDFPVTNYQVLLYEETSGPPHRNETSNGQMQITFNGLKDNTTYFVRVSAINGVEHGSVSDFVEGKTLPNGTVGITTGVNSADISDVGFTVKWNATDAGGSNFKIKSYRVDVLKNGTVVKRLEVDGTITQADIDGLEAATTYEVVIYADNGNGYGSSSTVLTVTTKAVECRSDDSNIGYIIGTVIGFVAGIILTITILRIYSHHQKDDGNNVRKNSSTEETKRKPTLDQMTQSTVYELSIPATYAEVCPAEKQDTNTTSPAYSAASNL